MLSKTNPEPVTIPGYGEALKQHFCEPVNPRDKMSKFLKNIHAQIERHEEKKHYPKKLISLRNQLRDINRKATFQMYSTLSLTFTHPMTGDELIGLIREINSSDLILITPQLHYSVVFENCETGIECFLRMKKSGFFAEPKKPLFDIDSTHGGINLNDLSL